MWYNAGRKTVERGFNMEALYILLALLALIVAFIAVLAVRAAAVGKKARPIGEKPVWHSEEEDLLYAQRLVKMIECRTVSSKDVYDDTEFAKLRAVMKELFPLVHERAEIKYFSEDCWVYKIEGVDTSRNILLMSHHDVVPAAGEWSHEPFGEIDDGVVWGRGTVDTKTPLFAEFTAVEELLSDGYIPPCNLYIASGHNEEIFGDGIKEAVSYFKAQGITFEMALDEGGGIIEPPLSGIDCKCAMMAVHEKGYHRVNVRAVQGDSAGLGVSNSPVLRVSKFIAEVSRMKFTCKMPTQVRAMFEALAPYMSFPLRMVFGNLWCMAPLLIKLIPKISPQAAAMLGTTCAFGSIESKKGEVPRDNECSASALVRYMDEEDLERDMEKFRALARKYSLEVTEPEDGHEFHRGADLSLPQYEYIRRCAAEVFPYAAVAPFVLAAGTDARWMSDVCPCTLRFAPIDINNQQFASVHGPDENIDIKAIGSAVEFYKTVLKNYE